MRELRRCSVDGTGLDRSKIDDYIGRSLMLVTALIPYIGYDNASTIAHKANNEGTSLREVSLALGVPTTEFDRIVDPKKMVGDPRRDLGLASPAGDGIVTQPSPHSFDETVSRLLQLIEDKGLTLFAVIVGPDDQIGRYAHVQRDRGRVGGERLLTERPIGTFTDLAPLVLQLGHASHGGTEAGEAAGVGRRHREANLRPRPERSNHDRHLDLQQVAQRRSQHEVLCVTAAGAVQPKQSRSGSATIRWRGKS